MIKELNVLRELGAQKISEDTHIAVCYIQSIIHESFDGLTKIQFLGFISILEREYKEDLTALKIKGLEYFSEEENKESFDGKVFVIPQKKANYAGLYILIVLTIFTLAIYASFDFKSANESIKNVDNHAIEDARKRIKENKKPVVKTVPLDTNITKVSVVKLEKKIQNTKQKPIEKKIVKVQVKHSKSVKKERTPLVIKPRQKVWIGYINKTDHTKHQAFVKNILTLNADKTWLISMGHGNTNMIFNGKKHYYSSAKSVRYIYKDGILKKLSVLEFKKMNNGRLW